MHLITKFVRNSAINVFSTMLKHQLDVTAEIPESELPTEKVSGLAGSVDFSGAMNGTIYLLVSEKYARDSSVRLFGEKRCALKDYSKDLVGELTNMVTGYVKSRLADRGLDCGLTPPKIIRGEELSLGVRAKTMSFYNQFTVRQVGEMVQIFIFVRIELSGWRTGLMDLINEEIPEI